MAGILLNRSRQVPAEETPAFGGIAERFRRAGDLDRAIALCRDGLKRFPEQLSARVTLGWALLDKGQYDLARSELEQVLRKAPDNLAAIRGLAELHDRTEGALPPEDERSWKTDDTPAVAAPAAAVAAAPTPERFAPIPVSLSSAAAEVLHTAAHAEQTAEAAASAFEPSAGLTVGPVELEDPAAASMAAAEPAPFFVVEPVETVAFDPGVSTAAPVPFEVAGVDPVEVEIETPGAAALSAVDPVEQPRADAVDLHDLASLAFQATGADFVTDVDEVAADLAAAQPVDVDDEIDWAGLASLTGTASLDAAPVLDTAFAATDESSVALPAAEGAIEAQIDVTFEPLSSLDAAGEMAGMFGSIEDEPSTVFAAPEGLDDIDEVAGQELADAIKALEEAAKRVEARLAPAPFRNEPATSPEEIAAYDFGPDPAAGDVDEASAASTLFDTRRDGSFELAAPDMTDLSFGFEPSGEKAPTDSDDLAFTPASGEVSAPALDFDATPSGVADDIVEHGSTIDGLAPSTDITLDVVEDVVEAAVLVADAGADLHEAAELDEKTEVAEAVAAAEITQPGEPSDAADVAEIPEGPEVAVVAGRADVAAIGQTTDHSDAEVVAEGALLDTDAEVGTAAAAPGAVESVETGDEPGVGEPADAVDEALSLAAMVATDWPAPAFPGSDAAHTAPAEPVLTEPAFEPALAGTTPAFAPEAGLMPVMHVYDSPVLTASAAATAVADVLARVATDDTPAVIPTMGLVQTSTRSPLAALERFLRKVQARQLELRGETVA